MAKLEAQRHAASLSQRNAEYERSVVEKEREALLEHQAELSKQREAAEKERSSLSEASSKLQSARDAVREMAEETEAQRMHVASLAKATSMEAESIAARQKQLQEQAAELLRGVPNERGQLPPRPSTAGASSGGGGSSDAPAGNVSINPWTAPSGSYISRSNYTAAGLGAFTIPLMATRAAGLPSDALANIEAATLATTTNAANTLAAAASTEEDAS